MAGNKQRSKSRKGNRVVADARGASRPAILSGSNPVANWWSAVAGWFAFIHRRRIDRRFAVFPGTRRTVVGCAAFLVCLGLLIMFADARYLEMVRQDGWAPSGFFEIITELGASKWILYPTGIALILYSIFRPGGMASRSDHLLHTALLAVYYVFTTTAFSGLAANLLKNVIGRARPEFVAGSGVWESFPFRVSYDFASFPSGHATTAGAFTIAFALLFPRLRYVFLFIGPWIAISRPAIGVHFPSDVFTGFCFGGAFSYYYARAFARKRLLFGFDESGRVLPRFRLPDLRLVTIGK
jgi:membrane-associated phospholipid phosphatase